MVSKEDVKEIVIGSVASLVIWTVLQEFEVDTTVEAFVRDLRMQFQNGEDVPDAPAA